MDIDYMFRNIQICLRITLVKHDKEQIKSTHNRRAHLHIRSQRLFAVVPATNGIRSGKNGRSSVESGMNTGFGDRDGLLFHSLVDGDLV